MPPSPSFCSMRYPPTVEPIGISTPPPRTPVPRAAAGPVSRVPARFSPRNHRGFAGKTVGSGQGGVVERRGEIRGGVVDGDGAGLAQLVVPEPAGADDERRHPRVLRGL